MKLATHEWNRMKASGSRECFNCHNLDGMNASKQKPRAQTNHAKAQKEGKTCIDCHKGIAHLLAQGVRRGRISWMGWASSSDGVQLLRKSALW